MAPLTCAVRQLTLSKLMMRALTVVLAFFGALPYLRI